MKNRKDVTDEWNKLHSKLVRHMDSENRNITMTNWCEQYILEAKEAYYLKGTPIIDDEAFDMLENSLRTLKPDSEVLKKVGA